MKRIIFSSLAFAMVLIFCSSAFAQAPEKPTNDDKDAIRNYVIQQKKYLKAQPYPKGSVDTEASIVPPVVAGAMEVPSYPKFISYPTSNVKPWLIANEEDPEMAKTIHDLHLKHWYFIHDQAAFKKIYGELPQNLPGGLTAAEYASNPPMGAFSADLVRYYSAHSSDAPAE